MYIWSAYEKLLGYKVVILMVRKADQPDFPISSETNAVIKVMVCKDTRV
jgi:hypothetical protein